MEQENQFEQILDKLSFDDVVVVKGEYVCFQGNIIDVDKEGGFFKFHITHSTDEDSIGKEIAVNQDFMDAMFDSLEIRRFKRSKQDVLSLIDFILDTKPLDKEWLEKKRRELIAIENYEKFMKSRKMVVVK
jgi:hypothetical protein